MSKKKSSGKKSKKNVTDKNPKKNVNAKKSETPAGGKKQNKTVAEKNRKRKKLIIIFIVVDILLAIGVGCAFIFDIFHFEDVRGQVSNTEFEDDTDVDGDEEEKEKAIKTLNELRDCTDLSSILREWAVNGSDEDSLMSSKNVINFLLIGVDASGGNSDVMMLMSLDKKNEKIYLNSFMRDSYTYLDTPSGEQYAKMNAAYANGGVDCLINTIQHNYKIKIDNYFLVDFNTFVEVVDIIGGIDVPVQAYEARAAGIPEYGDSVHLTGKQALWYCRIRKCDIDGDVSRTRRQRQFITAVIEKTKQVKVSQIDDILDTLLSHIKTDCSTTKLVSLASQALLNKWYNYEIVSQSYPLPENRLDYSGFAWVWIVDYPPDAKALQESIYGKTNIVLNKNRITTIDVMRNGQSGSAMP